LLYNSKRQQVHAYIYQKEKKKIATHTLPGQLVTDNWMANSFSRHTHPTVDLFFESSIAGFH
jgi:hypothetical protein